MLPATKFHSTTLAPYLLQTFTQPARSSSDPCSRGITNLNAWRGDVTGRREWMSEGCVCWWLWGGSAARGLGVEGGRERKGGKRGARGRAPVHLFFPSWLVLLHSRFGLNSSSSPSSTATTLMASCTTPVLMFDRWSQPPVAIAPPTSLFVSLIAPPTSL